MEKEEIWITTVHPSSVFCRICVSSDDGDLSLMINQPMDEYDGATSLQMMLEKLFPSVFCDEQLRTDESMNWPTQICQDCKRKVLDAYSLYELCVASTERLRAMLSEECEPLGLLGESESDFLRSTQADDGIKVENVSQIRKLECAAEKLIQSEDAPETACNSNESPRKTTRKRTSREVTIKSIDGSGHSRLNLIVNAMEGKEADDESCSGRQANNNTPSKERCKPRPKKTKGKTIPTNMGKKQTNGADSEDLDRPKMKPDLFRCQLCDGPTYGCPTELTEHLRKEHAEQIRSCALCPKVFVGEQAFQHHQYCHATGRSHFCMFCDKGFQKQNLLESHIRTHTKRGDFLCSLCGKEFTNHTNLRQHAKIKHSGEKPWACTLCPSRFTTKGSLKMHQYTHTKVKKFSCETCGTQFTKHSSLVKHRLIHTGERPFVCEVCKMRFVSNYMLKRHMLTHTGEKPFKCTYCERSFAQSNDMVKHIRTHVGDNLYKCDRCDASYRLLSELRNHYTEHYRAGGASAECTALAEDSNIRFTTTYIMKLRMEKEKAETESGGAVQTL